MTPVGALAVAAPPRVRDRLRAAPDGPVPVVHAGPHAVYVDLERLVRGRGLASSGPGALRTASGYGTVA